MENYLQVPSKEGYPLTLDIINQIAYPELLLDEELNDIFLMDWWCYESGVFDYHLKFKWDLFISRILRSTKKELSRKGVYLIEDFYIEKSNNILNSIIKYVLMSIVGDNPNKEMEESIMKSIINEYRLGLTFLSHVISEEEDFIIDYYRMQYPLVNKNFIGDFISQENQKQFFLTKEFTGKGLVEESDLRNKNKYFSRKPLNEDAKIYPVDTGMIGIYFLIKNNVIIYIGKSTNVMNRISQHKYEKDFSSYAIIECDENEMSYLEADMIAKYQPEYNKSFPTNEEWNCVTKKVNLFLDSNKSISNDMMGKAYLDSENHCVIKNMYFTKSRAIPKNINNYKSKPDMISLESLKK